MQPAKPVLEMNDFPGMLSGVDPRDIPSGAAEEQVNLTCVVMGQMDVRAGIKEVVFE